MSPLLNKAEGFHTPSSQEKKPLSVWKKVFGVCLWHRLLTQQVMRKCAVAGQRKDKYLNNKDETGQQLLDKVSTWTSSLRHYDEQLDATTILNSDQAHYIAKMDYVALETDFSSSLLMIWLKFAYACSRRVNEIPVVQKDWSSTEEFSTSTVPDSRSEGYHLEYSTHSSWYKCIIYS